ncbi:MAG: alkane 1-monooxygenase [Chitinophagaceae bacterium]
MTHRIRAFKYLSPWIFFLGGWIAFTSTGWMVWLNMIWAWICVPLAELLIKPDPTNLDTAEEELVKNDPIYDWLLYGVVIVQYALLFLFLQSISDPSLSKWDFTGRILVMGLLCGSFGINVAHELGHRVNKMEQTFAKLLLLTSLYMHFFTEHNKGHHKNVATPNDPSSARKDESVYRFYFRTIFFSYLSAWHIANEESRKKTGKAFSFQNEMIWFQLIQLGFVGLIYFYFGSTAFFAFLGAAFTGILLLETVNYIEHYGLQRQQLENGKYERAMPEHSWNSDHVMGRLMLFELSRHSDHHYLASRKYQVLRHHEQAPQMPTGYPGMMLLSLVPPLWFAIMNRRLQSLN